MSKIELSIDWLEFCQLAPPESFRHSAFWKAGPRGLVSRPQNGAGMFPKTRKLVSIFALPVQLSRSQWVFWNGFLVNAHLFLFLNVPNYALNVSYKVFTCIHGQKTTCSQFKFKSCWIFVEGSMVITSWLTYKKCNSRSSPFRPYWICSLYDHFQKLISFQRP